MSNDRDSRQPEPEKERRKTARAWDRRSRELQVSEGRVRAVVASLSSQTVHEAARKLGIEPVDLRKRLRKVTPEERSRGERMWAQAQDEDNTRLARDARSMYYQCMKDIRSRVQRAIMNTKVKPLDLAKLVDSLAKVYDTLNRYPLPIEAGKEPTLAELRTEGRRALLYGAQQKNVDCIKLALELADEDYDPRRLGAKDDGSVAPDLMKEAACMDNEALREATFKIVKGGAAPKAPEAVAG